MIAILIKDFRRDRLEMVALGLLLIVPVVLLWLLSLLVVLVLAVQIGVASSVAFGVPAEVALLALPLWVLAFPAGLMAMFRSSRTKREALQYALGVPSLVMAGGVLMAFGAPDLARFSTPDMIEVRADDLPGLGELMSGATASLGIAAGMVVGSLGRVRHRRAVGLAAVTVLATVLIAAMWWLQLGNGLVFTRSAVAVLVVLIGVYVRALPQAAGAHR